MKNRTKLLLTLALISLFPSIAAYVALIGNPRISFSLRMNEYEAQQGMTAQKLQADLNAIVAAVEKSLSESYRMKVEPNGREDYKRQRRLAKTALLSEILSYEADLNAITESEKQQVQEIGTAQGTKGLDAVDQRELELLKELNGSLPIIKSNAEKLIQLSDSSSKTEGDFVESVFEPAIRGELAKTAQELARGTDHAAGENRRNIGEALKASY